MDTVSVAPERSQGANGSDGIAGDARINGHGGGISRSAGSVALSATILADNLAGSNYIIVIPPDMTNYISGGWNLIGYTTGCPIAYSNMIFTMELLVLEPGSSGS